MDKKDATRFFATDVGVMCSSYMGKNKQLTRTWKKDNPDSWNELKIKPYVRIRDVVNQKWECQKDKWVFGAKIKGMSIELIKYMVGKPESYGGSVVKVKDFLENKKWHIEAKRDFGEDIFHEIHEALKNNCNANK